MTYLLEGIGFYTLSEERAKNVSLNSPLWRCELIVSSKCNFKCPYCREIRKDVDKELSLDEAKSIIQKWADGGLKNVRFSGGEPTIWPHIFEAVKFARSLNIQRIAISSNGASATSVYDRLIDCGVNDFSISLDACCASAGDMMSMTTGYWSLVVENIRYLSQKVYTTVGIVLTEDNKHEAKNIIEFANDLGVHDIRVIPAAQMDSKLGEMSLGHSVLKKHKILDYRYHRSKQGFPARGIEVGDSLRCRLAIDDMAVVGDYHFPCIIFMREHGDPIGTVIGKSIQEIRLERQKWVENTDISQHPICSKNCLDVCVAHNNACEMYCNM